MDALTICFVVGAVIGIATLSLKLLNKQKEAEKLNKVVESVIVGVEKFADSELYKGNTLKKYISNVAEGNKVGKDLHALVKQHTD